MAIYSYHAHPKPKRRWHRWLIIALVILVGGWGLYLRSSPLLEPEVYRIESTASSASTSAVSLPWPGYGQAAVGARGHGVLATSSATPTPVPTASLSKVMTALAILKVKPLDPGEPGPNVPITQTDVDLFNEYTLKNGTVSRVVAGQKLTQYQALQSLLIRSSNNMADTLATWAFGSTEEFTKYANSYAKELGMHHTHFADTSGYSPETVSTANDLVILGEAALENPVIAEIVATWETDIPEAGHITNTNLFLDFEGNGVIGIKTGETDQAGGCYLVAAKQQLPNGQSVTTIAAVLGAPNHFAGQRDTMPLLEATKNNFRPHTLIQPSQAVGRYNLPWGGQADALAATEVSSLGWGNQTLQPEISLDSIRAPASHTKQVGAISNPAQPESPISVVLSNDLPAPSWNWRLRHLFNANR